MKTNTILSSTVFFIFLMILSSLRVGFYWFCMADISSESNDSSAVHMLSDDLSNAASSADISEILKKTRVSKSLTIKEVANDIKIRTTFLKNIEDNQFDKLPGYVYAVGFTRMYASYLGLDSNLIVSTLKSLPDFVDQDRELKDENLLPRNIKVKGSSSTLFISLLLVVIIGVAFGYFFAKQENLENVLPKNDDKVVPPVADEKVINESIELGRNKSEGFSFQ